MLLLLLACRSTTEPSLTTAAFGEGDDLLVGLHGRGDKPSSFQRLVEDRTDHRVLIPQAPTAHGDGWSWFDAREAEGVRASTELLAELIDHHDGDDRVVVFGFSQGGYLSLALATEHPELVDKVVAIGGDLPREMWPSKAPSNAPEIIVLHGEDDTVIPIGPTRSTVEHLTRNGWNVTFEAYPGLGHSISTPVRVRLDQELSAD
ncbi:MAG: alpha/beta fold hydrolase [Proteobacteria bacterium]|nr:alpha/beta fold hydrolase [Pseudomonadota bacterium]MCP4919838.1 alpha/beta fold hydrolase [Pseudomonadota bacterium]